MLVALLIAALLALSSVQVASEGMRQQGMNGSAWGLETTLQSRRGGRRDGEGQNY
jgi:hypothetical protein